MGPAKCGGCSAFRKTSPAPERSSNYRSRRPPSACKIKRCLTFCVHPDRGATQFLGGGDPQNIQKRARSRPAIHPRGLLSPHSQILRADSSPRRPLPRTAGALSSSVQRSAQSGDHSYKPGNTRGKWRSPDRCRSGLLLNRTPTKVRGGLCVAPQHGLEPRT